jgi:hypothetical protein
VGSNPTHFADAFLDRQTSTALLPDEESRRDCGELFERRQKNFGRDLVHLTPARMAIAAEAFELLGDRDDVRLLEVVRAGLVHENAKTASVPFGNLFDEFLAAKAVCRAS